MNPIIGHQKILSFFEQVISRGALAHAYCFIGPKHVGRRTVAEEIAAKLYGISRSKLPTIADVIKISQEKDEKTDKTKRDISIEQIHRLTAFLSQSALLGGYKVAIIDGAEKMNPASANALLKTLEEPRGKTILFLIADNEAEMPATILSRCQTLYFQPVRHSDIISGLEARGVVPDTIQEIVTEARGLPGLAIDWSLDQEAFISYQQEKQRFISLRGQPFYAKLQAVDDLFGDKTDHIAAREQLLRILSIWQYMLRSEFYQDKKQSTVAIYDAIEQAKQRLLENIHPRLLVEQILLTIE